MKNPDQDSRFDSLRLPRADGALSRAGIEALVEISISDMLVLRRPINPASLRMQVENNIEIGVELGDYLRPSTVDEEAILSFSRLQARCEFEHGPRDLEDEMAGPTRARQ